MRMIRKQLYVGPEQQQKLQRLAVRWDCTEAEVMRSALDRLPDPDGSVVDQRAAAGSLASPPLDEGLPGDEAGEKALEREFAEWISGRSAPPRSSEAVLEDRRWVC